MADSFHVPMPPSFCAHCGGTLTEKVLPTEDRPRLACDRGHISYLNPKLIANVIPERESSLLLMRRAIEPRYGSWTMPGGFVEIDESPEKAAIREAQEEVNLEVSLSGLVGVYSRPAPDGPGVVALVFCGSCGLQEPTLGREALEVRWFTPGEIPWSELSYETTRLALRDWLEGRMA